ncbi:outer membrane beta-barrel protein [Rubrolithibacter danxiaensis]|uniref:outer membrane beta-barrel protein n=1 Tax=Rubrolithibacter danxiaensis TaxID=3390805 RepID=UPI003BF84F19
MRVILSILICLSITAKAQQLQIKGKIADSVSQQGLEYITVSLKTEKNEVVKTVLTRDKGTFAFSGLKPSVYLVSTAAVGYTPANIRVNLGDSSITVKDLGTVYLNTASTRLNEVVVTAEKPLVKQEIDRLSYDLQADPESKVKNVLEMMRKVPLLSVDAQDNVQLQGNSNYKILVNGKPSSMMEKNAKDVLKSMPASSIQKIEVITTPPAKYDGEGLTGIINIITNKKADNGYNGSINLNGRAPVWGPGIGGSLTAKAGRFGISAYGGASSNNSPETESFNQRLGLGENSTNLIQNGLRESSGKSGYFGSDFSFEIDSLNLISAEININGNKQNGLNNQYSVLNGGETEILQQYNLMNESDGSGVGADASLNYQLGFKADKNRLLTLSYRYSRYLSDDSYYSTLSNPVNFTIPDYRQNNTEKPSEQTFQLDYVHPVKKITVEAGVKAILRSNESEFNYLSLNTANNQFETDPSRTNNFNNTQNVFAVYNAYQFGFKDWGFKAGLRLEQTIVKADFISAATNINQNYLNFIPSVSINKKLKDGNSLNFGFTSRLQRPGIYHLNPFVDRSNPDFERSGNPELQPMTSKGFELRYNRFKKGNINIGANYILFKKLIMPVTMFNPVTNIIRSSFANTGKARLLGANFHINYPVTKKWSTSASARFNYGWVEGMINGIYLKNEGLMPGVAISSNYRFNKGWNASAEVSYNGKNISIQGKSDSFTSSSFSLNKDVVKDKLSFSIATSNPFSKYRYSENRAWGNNFSQYSSNQDYWRSYTFSINYKFGKLKGEIKKNQRGIRNDDLTGGSKN